MAKNFVRDSIGRFAKTAARRAGKKIRKGVESAANAELERIESAAQAKLDDLKAQRDMQRAFSAQAAAEKSVDLAKVHLDHCGTDGECEHAEAQLIKAQERLAKARLKVKELKGN